MFEEFPLSNDRQIRLGQIRARVEAATPGPWLHNDHYACVQTHSDEADLCAIARYGNSVTPISDFNFIAAAREDVPWLLREVARLQAALRVIADNPSWRADLIAQQAITE